MRAAERRANARQSRRTSTLLLFSGGFALIAASSIFVEAARLALPEVFDTFLGLAFSGLATGLMGAAFYFREKRVLG